MNQCVSMDQTMKKNGYDWYTTCSMCEKSHSDSNGHFGISDETYTIFEWLCGDCAKQTTSKNPYKFSRKYKTDKLYIKWYNLITYCDRS